jgi:hypothetical protein
VVAAVAVVTMSTLDQEMLLAVLAAVVKVVALQTLLMA